MKRAERTGQTSRETGGENAKACLAVIASAAKQSMLPHKERMDCFAALAMTIENVALVV